MKPTTKCKIDYLLSVNGHRLDKKYLDFRLRNSDFKTINEYVYHSTNGFSNRFQTLFSNCGIDIDLSKFNININIIIMPDPKPDVYCISERGEHYIILNEGFFSFTSAAIEFELLIHALFETDIEIALKAHAIKALGRFRTKLLYSYLEKPRILPNISVMFSNDLLLKRNYYLVIIDAFCLLHEIAHLELGHERVYDFEVETQQELEADEWALNVLFNNSILLEQDIVTCLSTYHYIQGMIMAYRQIKIKFHPTWQKRILAIKGICNSSYYDLRIDSFSEFIIEEDERLADKYEHLEDIKVTDKDWEENINSYCNLVRKLTNTHGFGQHVYSDFSERLQHVNNVFSIIVKLRS
ncbi:MAG: ImmA/IrrE family metallo-endopeptidase [Alteromonadaceae bacterium]|nr:ImmA/IrrE family metallo-endopeptidase [Alteromonadaceae bacterium]